MNTHNLSAAWLLTAAAFVIKRTLAHLSENQRALLALCKKPGSLALADAMGLIRHMKRLLLAGESPAFTDEKGETMEDCFVRRCGSGDGCAPPGSVLSNDNSYWGNPLDGRKQENEDRRWDRLGPRCVFDALYAFFGSLPNKIFGNKDVQVMYSEAQNGTGTSGCHVRPDPTETPVPNEGALMIWIGNNPWLTAAVLVAAGVGSIGAVGCLVYKFCNPRSPCSSRQDQDIEAAHKLADKSGRDSLNKQSHTAQTATLLGRNDVATQKAANEALELEDRKPLTPRGRGR